MTYAINIWFDSNEIWPKIGDCNEKRIDDENEIASSVFLTFRLLEVILKVLRPFDVALWLISKYIIRNVFFLSSIHIKINMLILS